MPDEHGVCQNCGRERAAPGSSWYGSHVCYGDHECTQHALGTARYLLAVAGNELASVKAKNDRLRAESNLPPPNDASALIAEVADLGRPMGEHERSAFAHACECSDFGTIWAMFEGARKAAEVSGARIVDVVHALKGPAPSIAVARWCAVRPMDDVLAPGAQAQREIARQELRQVTP